MCVHASIEALAWESEFFHRRCARLNFSADAPVIDASQLAAFDVVQAKIAANQVALADALADLNFRLVEGEVDLAVSIGTENAEISAPERQNVRLAGEGDISWLKQQAAQAFALSRFRAPWYQNGDSGRFYALWAEKAVLGTFDHRCLIVGDEQGAPQGFVTLRDLDGDDVRIGLLAVAPGAAGRGVGGQLMGAATAWCRQHDKRTLRVATQTGNVGALRLYIRSGAQITSTAYWLYR
ncbi:dTDP-4-amino-4,6-dideoxy-D-galactose acyltransferase [Enterobacillus tribolii]|uniref:dTDP-fucosamine acetyltransferase n=1 Tax=Enterobacillus tribolii TaxID=1487935 RepID=A0A370Q9T2_9GAMM|nr:dTDP-4-amino-4,6-dideoxy-D-galactose acyltransferase [Enterobacillus tribolii]MBW7984511.1 dTDP-4-amino-4,6-dideoxy-D-galactose acyltransferase [Enterobacillus tribolii]RDK85107.1 dTDP-4-amino-4,6-dideoxy-D-galactose acyltransferase [Enterobacillus tribolii]